MSKLSRQFLQLFGTNGNSNNFGQFGSKVAGTPIKTKDIQTIQGLPAYLNGWQDAIVNSDKAPYLEDMNSLFWLLFYQMVYVLEEGIPEWDPSTTYYVGATVRDVGTQDIYTSRQSNNLNNPISSKAANANWAYLEPGDLPGFIKPFAGNYIPDGYLNCDGSAISRTTYLNLFNQIGITWGPGDSSTTFNIPDLRGRTLFGQAPSGTFMNVGATGGLQTADHTHTTPNHQHSLDLVGPAGGNTGGGTQVRASGANGLMEINPTGIGPGSYSVNAQTQVSGGGVTGDTNIPILNPYAVVQYLIKF